MARQCKLTGKGPLAGNKVSHSNRKSRRVQRPNLQSKRVYVPELGRHVRIRVSTRALRTIDKKGLSAYLKSAKLRLEDLI